MIYTPENPPRPWEFTGMDRLPWPEEDFNESLYPKGGFLEDAVNFSKGYETTNAFAFWSGVHTLSSVIMRDSYLRWAHGGLYPNFYVLFVAPPGVVKKSTTAKVLDSVENGMHKLLDEKNKAVAFEKQACMIRGKATQEAIFENMRNATERVTLKHEDGTEERKDLERNSNLIMRISELSTLLSSSKYNVNLIDKLTDFYDCKDRDSDTTIGRGSVELKNVFATMWGATTPDTLRSTIPREAFGGGFMSRCLIIRQQVTPRSYPHPVHYPFCPSQQEMAERLAWIAMYKRGEYILSPEAYTHYASWYHAFKRKLSRDIQSGIYNHIENRKDIHILKLAHIIALQRYELKENVITLEDIKYAIKIVNWTLGSSFEEVQEAGMDKAAIKELTIEKFIKQRGEQGVTRRKILQSLNREGVKAKVLTDVIDELHQRGVVSCYDKQGQRLHKPKNSSDELYKYLGD